MGIRSLCAKLIKDTKYVTIDCSSWLKPDLNNLIILRRLANCLFDQKQNSGQSELMSVYRISITAYPKYKKIENGPASCMKSILNNVKEFNLVCQKSLSS